MEKSIPVIGLAGYSGSGKTTFLEKLVGELKSRGYRVGVVKHTHQQVQFDQPGKDTWRFARAGADVVALAAPGGVKVVSQFEGDPAPEEVLAMISGVDLVIVEGYKRGKWPKIEVFHRGVSRRPAVPPEELLAVVGEASPGGRVTHFSFDHAAGVADLIEREILKK